MWISHYGNFQMYIQICSRKVLLIFSTLGHKTPSKYCLFVMTFRTRFLALLYNTLKHKSASWKTQELEWWFWQSLSLSLHLCLLHSLSCFFCSRLSLFPVYSASLQDKTWALVSSFLHSCSHSAESLPGVALLRAPGGEEGEIVEE